VVALVRQAKTGSSDATFINCISLKTKRIIKSCVIGGRYNTLEVCIDGRQTDEQQKMKAGLQNLPNILVIGGDESKCILITLGQLTDIASTGATELPKRIPLLRKL
jgi:hypothetical protein